MQIAQILTAQFPNAKIGVDYQVVQDIHGQQTITEWTAALGTQPTLADLQTAWPAVELASAISFKAAQINAAAQSALAEIVASYPALEVSTWDQQYSEAVAWTANNATATPILSDISAACGIPVAELAPAVIAKATAYKSASGAVIGKRLALTAAIYAATTPQAVVQINW